MKKNLHLISLAIICTNALIWLSNKPAEPTAETELIAEARKFTEEMYQQLIVAVNHYQDEAFIVAYDKFVNKFDMGRDQNMPNDFLRLLNKPLDLDRAIISSLYFWKVSQWSNDKNITSLRHRIIEVVIVAKPKLDNKKKKESFVKLIVEREISDNKGSVHLFNDTVFYNAKIQKIAGIYNDVYPYSIALSHNLENTNK